MTEEKGIGDSDWINDYIGIPYEVGGRNSGAIDCYGLVCKVYHEMLGVELPDWVLDDEIDFGGERGSWTGIDKPVDFCILRSARLGGVPDHFALYVGGGVLSAGQGGSLFTTLNNYLSKNGSTTYGVYTISGCSH